VPPSSRVARTLEDRIAEGDQVRLQYKNRQLFVIVIKVVAPQERYEGRVQGFVPQERYEGRVQGFVDSPTALEIDGLEAGASSASATTIFGALNEGRPARRSKEKTPPRVAPRAGFLAPLLTGEIRGAAGAALPTDPCSGTVSIRSHYGPNSDTGLCEVKARGDTVSFSPLPVTQPRLPMTGAGLFREKARLHSRRQLFANAVSGLTGCSIAVGGRAISRKKKPRTGRKTPNSRRSATSASVRRRNAAFGK
jgi:hypothetical protein